MRLLRAYVPPNREMRAFAAAALADSVGTGLYLAGAAIFAVRVVELSPAQVGVGMALAGVVGFLATAPIGALGARIDPLRLLRILQLWRGLGFVSLAFVHGLLPFTLVSMAIALGTGAVVPLTQCVVGSSTTDESRTRSMAIIRAVRNVGFSVGALAATPLIAVSSTASLRSIVLIDAATFVVAALLLGRLRTAPRTAPAVRNPLAALARFRDRSYLALAAVNGLLSLHISMLSVGIPLWALTHTQAPASLIAVLITVNTVMAIALQVPLTARAANTTQGLRRTTWRTGLSLAACCAALAMAADLGPWQATAALVAATVLLTFGEIWQATVGWEFSYRYADPDQRPVYLAAFSLGGSAQEIVGPLLLTSVVITLGAAGWIALAVVFIAAAALAGPLVRNLDMRRSDPAAVPAS